MSVFNTALKLKSVPDTGAGAPAEPRGLSPAERPI